MQRQKEEVLRKRIAELADWVRMHGQGCEDEQAHLEEGSRERAYWHCGYLVALRDVLALFTGRRNTLQ